MPDDMIDKLRQIIHYDPETGVLYRRETMRPITTVIPKGYILVGALNRRLYGHRLAWALHYGAWPSQHIDHINGNKVDNRIANLRDVEPTHNSHNAKPRSDNKLGLRGVSPHKSGWYRSSIKFKGTVYNLGVYPTPEAAYEVRLKKEDELGIFRYKR
jgi:hypothetical protein